MCVRTTSASVPAVPARTIRKLAEPPGAQAIMALSCRSSCRVRRMVRNGTSTCYLPVSTGARCSGAATQRAHESDGDGTADGCPMSEHRSRCPRCGDATVAVSVRGRCGTAVCKREECIAASAMAGHCRITRRHRVRKGRNSTSERFAGAAISVREDAGGPDADVFHTNESADRRNT
jgi:hypothetical protein